MSLEGQQLGEFEIIERLGQGGMGEVYKARQTSLGRIVALKTLHASLAGDAHYIARFRKEARAAAALNHPNLVQVISAGENDGLHWFAMEYVEGESAKGRLERKGRLDPLAAIAIAIHVATALDYAWRKAALIHSDIKPDNIFLSGDGEVKLGDLGLAKSAEQTRGLTMTGASVGTPHYISPEQAEARKDIDQRADIYSLGCTLYHLLSGQPPYTGNSAVAVLIKHVSAPAPDLRRVWPKCPAELAAAVMKMMQKQPADRQQNYEEVIADLRRAYAVLSGARAPSVVTAARQPVASQKPVAGERKSAASVAAWISRGVALLAAVGALLYFAPWKDGGANPGGARSGASQTSTGGGGDNADGGSRSKEATPASGRTVAVATTPQPDATLVSATSQSSAPSTAAQSATPKQATEVEKWFAQVDAPQQESFQKQVLKPFEAGVADLQARYLASLDAAIAKASAAGQLADALVWRTERQAFEKTQSVASDDAGTPSNVRALRATFRQQFARLNDDRKAKAKALFAPYDAILAKNQTLLTQNQHLDDALLLQTKRDEIALAWLGSAQPTTIGAAGHPKSAKSSSALLASKDAPFVNSFGMKFVPVPITGGPTNGKRVLFSVWDTRVQDYQAFAKESKRGWPNAGFEQGPTHPAVMVSWDDAKAFCAWMTAKERASGRIGGQDEYRLPSDHEWSCAVGIGRLEKAEESPESKSGQIGNVYPWGTQWPPPKGAGNYGPSLQVDDYEKTSPVGSFEANHEGLYDMGGNVWQWCEDWFDAKHERRMLRGAAWVYNDQGALRSTFRHDDLPTVRDAVNGFRCVLAISGGDDPKLAQAPMVPPSAPKEASAIQLASATKESPFVNSLEMKFAPVRITGGPTDGQRVLFSVWDTRVQDYAVFAQEIGRDWPKPDFLQGPTHPAVMVSWEDAQLFCRWLTGREQAAGRLPAGWSYRLPSDHEWSCAVGIGARENAAKLPVGKDGKISDAFPWGFQWPPPIGVGNYHPWLQVDKFKNTSPVGSFSANRYGLRDLGGNVWQWCEDLFVDKDQKDRVLRGASWDNNDRDSLLSSHRNHNAPGARSYNYGFRCVVGGSAR